MARNVVQMAGQRRGRRAKAGQRPGRRAKAGQRPGCRVNGWSIDGRSCKWLVRLSSLP